jgi:hypothetical protein
MIELNLTNSNSMEVVPISQTSAPTIPGLPENISFEVFSYLFPEDICRSGKVCKAWQKFTQDEHLWKSVAQSLKVKIDAESSVSIKKQVINYYAIANQDDLEKKLLNLVREALTNGENSLMVRLNYIRNNRIGYFCFNIGEQNEATKVLKEKSLETYKTKLQKMNYPRTFLLTFDVSKEKENWGGRSGDLVGREERPLQLCMVMSFPSERRFAGFARRASEVVRGKPSEQ